MTEQERINEEIKKQLAIYDAKFLMMFEELRQQREDMRRQQDRQDAMQAKHDVEMHEMNQRFYEKIDENAREFTKQLHANFIQTMLGFGAIAATVGGIVIAAFK